MWKYGHPFIHLSGPPGHRESPGKQPREHRRSTDMTYTGDRIHVNMNFSMKRRRIISCWNSCFESNASSRKPHTRHCFLLARDGYFACDLSSTLLLRLSERTWGRNVRCEDLQRD